MTLIQQIAIKIAERGRAQHWTVGTKTADKLNLEAWIGAWIALEEGGHPQHDQIGTVVLKITRLGGYAETLRIAETAFEPPAEDVPFDPPYQKA